MIHPTGYFDATILDHGFATTGTGAEQFFTQFQTEHGTIVGYFFLTDKAAEHTMKKIRAMGYQGGDLSALADGRELRGHQCSITIDHEIYEGKTQAKVGWVNQLGETGIVERCDVTAANARRFNALLKKTPLKDVHREIPDQELTAEPYYDEQYPPPIGDDDCPI